MPKLARVFKELNSVNNFTEIYRKEYLNQVDKLNEQHEKSKEIDIFFRYTMFQIELHLIGSGLETFRYFLEISHVHFAFKNDSSDIIFLLIFKKLFNRIKREEPEVFKVYIGYVKDLKETREESQNECQLFYHDDLVDEGLRGLIDDLPKGIEKPSYPVCLSFNQLTQAKFFLRNILLDPDHDHNYLSFLPLLIRSKPNKDVELGFGWFLLHLNTLCEAKLKFFMHNHEKLKDAPKTHSLLKTQKALLYTIKCIETFGFLTNEVKYLLDFGNVKHLYDMR